MSESIVFKNSIGTITDKRVIYKYRGYEQSIPLHHISSITYKTKRYIFKGLLGLFLANIFISAGSFTIVFGLLLGIFSLFLLIGFPSFCIVTSGGSKNVNASCDYFIWSKSKVVRFVKELENKLFE